MRSLIALENKIIIELLIIRSYILLNFVFFQVESNNLQFYSTSIFILNVWNSRRSEFIIIIIFSSYFYDYYELLSEMVNRFEQCDLHDLIYDYEL